MEHRQALRKHVNKRAVVNCLRVGNAIVTVRDMSVGGMLVEGQRQLLPLHRPVIVAVDLKDGQRRNEFVLEAMVVRHSLSGAALMFSDLETDVLRTLHTALAGEHESSKSISG
jgi:PilZ domain-containing protein